MVEKFVRAHSRSASLALASQIPAKGCSATSMVRTSRIPLAPSRTSTEGRYAGSGAGTSAPRRRSQPIIRSRRIRCWSRSSTAWSWRAPATGIRPMASW